MPRKKKDAIRLTLKLERRIANDLENCCKQTGLNKTEAIETALDEFLYKIRVKNENNQKDCSQCSLNLEINNKD